MQVLASAKFFTLSDFGWSNKFPNELQIQIESVIPTDFKKVVDIDGDGTYDPPPEKKGT